MRSYKKIWDVKFHETDGTHSAAGDTRSGTVRVQYKDGTWEEFPNILRSDYFKWQRTRYNPRSTPAGISVKTSRVSRNPNPQDDEPDEQEIALDIHPRDYIGQFTGYPSPGFAERQQGQGTCTVDTSSIRHKLGLPSGPKMTGTNEGIVAAVLRKLEIRWKETLASMRGKKP